MNLARLIRNFAAVVFLIFISIVNGADAVQKVTRDATGMEFKLESGLLRVELESPRMIHVVFAKREKIPYGDTFAIPQIVDRRVPVAKIDENEQVIRIATTEIIAVIDRKTAAITFQTIDGKTITSEQPNTPRDLMSGIISGQQTQSAISNFALSSDEIILGLGQHQNGSLDNRGRKIHLQQANTDIAIPFLISSLGYGIIWNNPAVTDVSVGEKGSQNLLQFKSESADKIDYYFVYGPSTDQIISEVRHLTGQVPMMPKWSWGYWQCKERYVTQDEILNIAREYRKRQIPIDGIIQDWQYWSPGPWGSHDFGKNFPDPKKMVDEIHALNLHMLISVWAKFDKGSSNYDELEKAGYLYPPIYPNVAPKGEAKWYDAYNPGARKMYWDQMSKKLFSYGIDGWWLDATEPELGGKWGELRDLTTAAGPGHRVFNAYPLMTTAAVHDGQRAETSDKRVFILTRSAYLGQQRNATVVWSGDVGGNWATFRKQIPAGLNFVLSGIPYWNTDIGGFFSQPNISPEYRELFVRWFQFGTFNPMFRVHGTGTDKSAWNFGEENEKILRKYINLRYRLLPYIYSLSWQVTSNQYTMMRPLMMDFPQDAKAIATGEQFMFGPSILVAPVTQPQQGNTVVIPSESLVDLQNNPGGLSATYFSDMELKTKAAERKDETIAFNWDKVKREGVGADPHRDPIAGMPMDHFSARWEGFIKTRQAGEYQISVKGDDGFRLWIDNKLIIEDWKARPVATHVVKVNLPANTNVPVKLEYFQNVADAILELGWQEPAGDTPKIPTRSVYLPSGEWFDFWTGKSVTGGQSVEAPAPIETIPLYIRAGSIIPMGPFVQYANEKPSDPIELRIYPGADAKFTLYEDEGDNYNYEKGKYSTIDFTWNDKERSLDISDRKGEYPGMLKERTFNIVVMSEGKSPIETEKPGAVIHYTGQSVQVRQ